MPARQVVNAFVIGLVGGLPIMKMLINFTNNYANKAAESIPMGTQTLVLRRAANRRAFGPWRKQSARRGRRPLSARSWTASW